MKFSSNYKDYEMIKSIVKHFEWLVTFIVGSTAILVGVFMLYTSQCWDIQCRYSSIRPSVGMLHSNYGYMEGTLGTGTFIAPHYMLTAAHVVVDDYDGVLEVALDSGIVNSYVVAINKRLDMAIVYIPDIEGAPVVMGSDTTVAVGDRILTVGSPAGLVQTLGVGYISAPVAYDSEYKRWVVQYSADNFHGNSGGAVYNQFNQLIGVISYYRMFPSFTFAIAIDQAKVWIDTITTVHTANPGYFFYTPPGVPEVPVVTFEEIE